MILDAVLGDRRCWWLSPEADKRRFFGLTRDNWLRPEDYPHIAFGSGRQRTDPLLPRQAAHRHREGPTPSHFVFLYLVNRRLPVDFRQFLIRHADLFRFLRTWTVRLLVPRRFRKAVALYKAALREELWTPLNPSVSKALETYFPERQAAGRTPRRSGRSLHQRRSSGSRGCRRSRPSIEPGDDRATGCCGRSSLDRLARRSIARLFGRRSRTAEPPVPAAHRHDGPRCRGPRGGPSENRVRLAPRFRRPLQTLSHPWLPHDREPCASVSIAATCREHAIEAALCAAVAIGAGVAVAEPTMA